MDHSHMDHGGMDHGGMDHGDGGHGGMPMCNMNMLFTWDTTNLCIVFRQWHITGRVSLFFSLLAIVAICAGYEALREATRKYELWLSKQDGGHNFIGACRRRRRPRSEEDQEEHLTETTPFLGIERTNASTAADAPSKTIGQPARIVKAVLYGVQNFYAFMIMLLFMTYNGYVMIAVAVGAGVGYYLFGAHTRITKETACH